MTVLSTDADASFLARLWVWGAGAALVRPNPLTPFPKGKGGPEASVTATSPPEAHSSSVWLPLPFRGGGWGVGSASLRPNP